ncbi:MAG TPA: AraC family transcriptional regulator [Leptolyngbyaceae cyanobacterium]
MPKEQPQTVDLRGEYVQHIHLLESFEAGWESLHLIYEQEPAGEVPQTWFNQNMLVICVEDFQADYLLDGRWQHVDYANGDLAILPAHEPFPKTQIDRSVRLLELFLKPETLVGAANESVEAEQIGLVRQLKFRDPLIQQMGLALLNELEAGGADSRFYAESMATALSVHLLRRYSSRKQEIRNYTGGLPKYKLQTVIAYIHDHLDQNLTLAELAAVVQMSPHYFVSLFKQSTGLAPHQYLTQCRIERAKRLLLKRELTIIEICQTVGFQSQSHFTRVFRQHTGTTPKAYREAF